MQSIDNFNLQVKKHSFALISMCRWTKIFKLPMITAFVQHYLL